MYTLHTDSIHRIAYATDASAYRELPEGVAYPETEDDIADLIRLAHERHTHLIPRAGGTSIAGQVVGNGIVVDISKHFKKILEVNPEEKWVRVQPGVVLDELNIYLKPYGLFFSPETSTSNRCCIGGMVGNNSCGSHSLIYGSTRHHVLQLKGFLSDGSRFDTSVRSNSPLEQKIYVQLEAWKNDVATRTLIEESYPDKALRRRSCGYAIDEAIEGEHIDLCKLICGSEGTLAFVTEIKLSLDPLPPKEKMLLCAHCDTLQKSFLGNLVALKHHPAAVELMDSNILELSKDNVEQQRNRFFVEGNPAAILIIELRGETREEIDAVADAIEKDLYAETHRFASSIAHVIPTDEGGSVSMGDELGMTCVSPHKSFSIASATASISSFVSPLSSMMRMAAGSPSTKNRLRCCSTLSLLSSRMLRSISSTAAGWCFKATRLPKKLFCKVSQWAQSNIFSLGGNGSRLSLISVTKAKVPSEPQMSLQRSICSPSMASSMA